MSGRQHVSDQSPINPNTGLPKNVYDYQHPECAYPQIYGGFQMKGKKHRTKAIHYEGEDERAAAIEETVERLHKLKEEVGYYDYVNEQGWYKTVRRRAKNDYRRNQVSKQDNREQCSVLESIRRGSVTRRHI